VGGLQTETAIESRFVDLDGPVHYTDFGGTGQSMALAHGLGGASLNWMMAAPQLARRNRVLAPDLVGFGLTTLGDRRATMSLNLGVLHRFLERMGGQVVVVGNSMGGTLAMLEAAANPDMVRALVLVCPALPYPIGARIDSKSALLASLITAPGLARLLGRRQARSPEWVVKFVLALVTADPARVAGEAVQAHLELTRQRAHLGIPDRAFIQAARSIGFMLARRQAIDRAISAINVPTLLIQGARDRVVWPKGARDLAARRPDWTYLELREIGHVPMLEDPEGFASAVQSWLDTIESTRVEADPASARRFPPPATAREG
jgi:pimeloyl-ACP methyl ester carboxylesterase